MTGKLIVEIARTKLDVVSLKIPCFYSFFIAHLDTMYLRCAVIITITTVMVMVGDKVRVRFCVCEITILVCTGIIKRCNQ